MDSWVRTQSSSLPKQAAIAAALSGDNTIVGAVTGKRLRVLAVCLVAGGATTVRFESGSSGMALTGQMSLSANGGFVLPLNEAGWFETAVGALLNLELGGAVAVAGCLVYQELD
jgi:hypothetical protein